MMVKRKENSSIYLQLLGEQTIEPTRSVIWQSSTTGKKVIKNDISQSFHVR